ncbi:MAG TPA: CerR family C-terminal domain-containing protein, partial [Gemmatimonadales bacterium]|nr:CerR family C-terminal domain-containing protein [Gemmatimonadales bacterium]
AAIRQVGDLATQAPEGASPEERLRHYVRVYLPNLVRQDERHRWISRLMQHELSEPTPAAKLIAERAIRPRLEYLAGLVAALLECAPDDPRVRRSVMSIQAQCLFYLPRPFHQVVAPGAWPESDAEIERTAEHIVRFSLAGIRWLRDRSESA